MHPPGVFTAGENEIIFTGLFEVASISGPVGSVNPQWGPVTGGGKFFGSNFFPSGPGTSARDTENTADPHAHFTPLTLTASNFATVPEPATLSLFGAALVALALTRHRIRPRASRRR
jgi:hypothetical protein